MEKMNCIAVIIILVILNTVNASCPAGTVRLEVTKEAQNLTSPDYPSRYERNLTCHWFLYIKDYVEAVVEVKVLILDLENSTDCQKDKLSVSKGFGRHETVTNLCGTIQKPVVFLSATAADVTFTTDDQTDGSGFVIQYIALLDTDADGHKKPPYTSSWGIVVIAVCVVVVCILSLTTVIICVRKRRNPKPVTFESPFDVNTTESANVNSSN